jgi:hypothetical protein
LLQVLGPACCTLSAAFQQQQQQQLDQHELGVSESQQQQQQQHATMTALAHIRYVCLEYWVKGVVLRSEATAAAAAAAAGAAAGGATSSTQSSRTNNPTEEQPGDYSWLLPDPASATVLPAVAQLVMDMLQSPNTSSSASSSASSHSASTTSHHPFQNIRVNMDRVGSSSSSSSNGGARHGSSTQHPLQRWPARRTEELALAGKLVVVITLSVVELNAADSHNPSVQALLAEPKLQQLLLLDVALAAQALHDRQQGIAPMPEVAAAVADALQYSYAAHEQRQQQGEVDQWHKKLLLLLGVPPDEVAGLAAAAEYGADLDAANRACVALGKYLDTRQLAALQQQQAEPQPGSSSNVALTAAAAGRLQSRCARTRSCS